MRATLLVIAAALLAVLIVLTVPGPRRLAVRALDALRDQPVRTVNVNLSSFVGPNASGSLQDLVQQMISDKVVVTRQEDDQNATSAAAAGALAGFTVRLPGAETTAPRLTVTGARRVQITVDRARLQAILREAGRPDLTIPASADDAVVEVSAARVVEARYGHCPGAPSATANIATPAAPSGTEYADCVVLREGPSPVISVPSEIDLRQLVAIGLNLAGLTPAQAEQFLNSVDWQSVLTLPVPRSVRSYQLVGVGGARGTLFNTAGRRGPTYTLVWKDAGLLFALTGFGDSGGAVSIAESVR